MNSHEQAVGSPNARSTNRGMDDGTGLYVAACRWESWVYLMGRISYEQIRVILMRVGNFAFIPVFTHRMKNKQSSTKDLGPFRLVLRLWADHLFALESRGSTVSCHNLTNCVFQYLRFVIGSTAGWHIWQTMYFEPRPSDAKTTVHSGGWGNEGNMNM